MNEIESFQAFMKQQISHIQNALKNLNQKLKETPKPNHREIFRLKDQIDNLNHTLVKLEEEYTYKQKLIAKLPNNQDFILASIRKTPHIQTINLSKCSECKQQPLILTNDNAMLICMNCAKTTPFTQTTLDHIESSSFAQDTYANHSDTMYTKTKNSNFTHPSLNCY